MNGNKSHKYVSMGGCWCQCYYAVRDITVSKFLGLAKAQVIGSENRRGGYGKTIKKKGSTPAPEL